MSTGTLYHDDDDNDDDDDDDDGVNENHENDGVMIFSDPTDLSRGGDSFVGKLRSNMLGTQVDQLDFEDDQDATDGEKDEDDGDHEDDNDMIRMWMRM